VTASDTALESPASTEEDDMDRILSRCPVCGCSELRSDEVFDRGLAALTECPRCEFRVVERSARLPRAPLRVEWELAEEVALA
jgi:hypothetical protein